MARARTVPRHTATPARPPEDEHEHHSVFEERSVLDALWSAVVAAPTSVTPTVPDAEAATPEAEAAPPVARGTASVPASALIAPVSPAVGVAQPVSAAPEA